MDFVLSKADDTVATALQAVVVYAKGACQNTLTE
jgi:hypothetical protein